MGVWLWRPAQVVLPAVRLLTAPTPQTHTQILLSQAASCPGLPPGNFALVLEPGFASSTDSVSDEGYSRTKCTEMFFIPESQSPESILELKEP